MKHSRKAAGIALLLSPVVAISAEAAHYYGWAAVWPNACAFVGLCVVLGFGLWLLIED